MTTEKEWGVRIRFPHKETKEWKRIDKAFRTKKAEAVKAGGDLSFNTYVVEAVKAYKPLDK